MSLKANEYFQGNVRSIGFERTGLPASVGVINSTAEHPEYHFGTAAPERMTVVSGALDVKLEGEDTWHRYMAGTYWEVVGSSGFDAKSVNGPAAYLCEYLPTPVAAK